MSGLETGAAFLDVKPDLATFGTELQRGVDPAIQSMGSKISSTGSTLTKTLTPIAAGLSAVFAKSFQEWDTGIDSIRVSTGATGKALSGLEDSMISVGAHVTQPLSEVGEAMGHIAQRTGLVGKPLEDLTTQMLNLGRISGEDVTSSIGNVTRVFGDWGVATKDQSSTLDMLFRASQATGAGVNDLSASLVKFGAPLRQMGFGLGETAGLLGKFEKEGVNTGLVMGSLRIALGKMAADGVKDPHKALQMITDDIKNAGSSGKANAIALEAFGARAGPDMAAAIREGRFELGGLFKQVTEGKDTIQSASDDTLDLSDKFDMLKNRVAGALGPFGEIGSILAGAVAGIGPMLMGIGSLVTSFQAGGAAATIFNGILMAMPWILIAAAVVALAVLIVKNWDKIKEFLLAAWEKIKAVALAVWNGIKDFVVGIWNGIKTAASTIWNAIKTYFVTIFTLQQTIAEKVWGAIKDFLSGIWNGIKTAASTIWNAIKTYFVTVMTAYNTIITGAWNKIKEAVAAVWNAIKTAATNVWGAIKDSIKTQIDGVKTIMTNVWDAVKGIVTGAWDRIKEAVRGGVGGMLDLLREVPGKIVSALGNLGRLLWDAGRAIIQGLIDGIGSMLSGLYHAVGAIASKIKSLKGPISEDRKLLVPEGRAIMAGLETGIVHGARSVYDTVSGIGPRLNVTGVSRALGPATAGGGDVYTLNGNIIIPASEVAEFVAVTDFFDRFRRTVRQGS